MNALARIQDLQAAAVIHVAADAWGPSGQLELPTPRCRTARSDSN